MLGVAVVVRLVECIPDAAGGSATYLAQTKTGRGRDGGEVRREVEGSAEGAVHLYSPEMPHGPAFKRACGRCEQQPPPRHAAAYPYVRHGNTGPPLRRRRCQKVLWLQQEVEGWWCARWDDQQSECGAGREGEGRERARTPVVVIFDLGDCCSCGLPGGR